MSDQDTPPPMDENSPEEDAPPPMDSQADEPSTPESVMESIPTEAPPTSGIGVGQGKLGASDERTMGMLAHLLGGVTLVVGPLIIWMVKKDESPFVDDQGKEALNFQITMLIGHVVSFILGAITGGCASIILSPILWVVGLILAIIAGVDANKGKVYRYPFAVRLIS